MTFAQLGSPAAREALERMMEVQSVARAAKGLLKIDDVLGMKEIEAMAAFQLVRF